MRSAPSLSDIFTFGGRTPATVGGLIVAIIAASLLGAFVPGLVAVGAFMPALVWSGQLWRLVTWPLFESGPAAPLNLVFAALMLFWFGRDLCHAWGPRRFLATFLGLSAASAALTCLAARFAFLSLMGGVWVGPWVAITALTVAWALIFPERQILFMLALPVSGRVLLWLTIGGTVLYAVFGQFLYYVPHFLAQIIMVGYVRGWTPRGLWQSWRIGQFERRARRRASHLKVVKKEDRWLN